MKLPHIKIEYQEEESYALGKVSGWLIVGFGIHWAWIYLFLFNGGSLLYPDAPDAQGIVLTTSMATLAATFLCYGVLLKQARRIFHTAQQRMRARVVACVAVVAGMACAVACGAMGCMGVPAAVATGVLTGFGSTVLLMSFGVSFSTCDLPTIVVCAALSLPVTAGVFAALAVAKDAFPALTAALAMAMPVAELACLQACSHDLVDNLEFYSLTIPVHTKPFALHVCLPAFIFGMLLGALGLKESAVQGTMGIAGIALPLAAASLLCGLVLVAAMLTQRHTVNFTFRTMTPIVAFLLATPAFSPGIESEAASFCLIASYMMLISCIWVFFSDVSQRFRISVFTVFGFGWGTLTIGILAGMAASLPGAPIATSGDTTSFMAAALVALTLGVALMPTNAELRHTLKRGRLCPALVRSDDFALDRLEDGVFGNVAEPGRKTADGADAAEAPATSSAPTSAADPATVAPEEGAEHKAQGATGTQAAGEGKPEKATKEKSKRAAAGRFKRKCQACADRYLLTRKEAEVLFLLAKGRNSSAIQESLFISEGTANTHLRHIYRKLGVHSQAELIKLVESEQVEDINL